MMDPKKLAAIQDRMREGKGTYEDAADLYFSSRTGAYGVAHGVTRELFMQKMQRVCPTPEALAEMLRAYAAEADRMFPEKPKGPLQ